MTHVTLLRALCIVLVIVTASFVIPADSNVRTNLKSSFLLHPSPASGSSANSTVLSSREMSAGDAFPVFVHCL